MRQDHAEGPRARIIDLNLYLAIHDFVEKHREDYAAFIASMISFGKLEHEENRLA